MFISTCGNTLNDFCFLIIHSYNEHVLHLESGKHNKIFNIDNRGEELKTWFL